MGLPPELAVAGLEPVYKAFAESVVGSVVVGLVPGAWVGMDPVWFLYGIASSTSFCRVTVGQRSASGPTTGCFDSILLPIVWMGVTPTKFLGGLLPDHWVSLFVVRDGSDHGFEWLELCSSAVSGSTTKIEI